MSQLNITVWTKLAGEILSTRPQIQASRLLLATTLRRKYLKDARDAQDIVAKLQPNEIDHIIKMMAKLEAARIEMEKNCVWARRRAYEERQEMQSLGKTKNLGKQVLCPECLRVNSHDKGCTKPQEIGFSIFLAAPRAKASKATWKKFAVHLPKEGRERLESYLG